MIDVGDGIVLAPLTEQHVDAYALLAAENRALLGRWFLWPHADDPRAAIASFVSSLDEARSEKCGDAFALLVEGVLAGSVGIHDVDRTNDVGRLGYWIGARFGGRGVMTRAVRRLTQHAFEVMRLQRLEVLAGADNAPSRALAQRALFSFEGTLRGRLRTAYGFEDAALYARLERDELFDAMSAGRSLR